MKRRLSLILIAAFMLMAVGCEAKNTNAAPPQNINKPVEEEIKATIPMEQRKYIYNNGLSTEYKNINKKDNEQVDINFNYPIISGLKDKSIQEKINNELYESPQELLAQLEASIEAKAGNSSVKYSSKRTNTYIYYSCNNVLFVEYYASIEPDFRFLYDLPNYKVTYCGYDLNTGDKLSLKDIFKPGSDYKTKINNFICQYIIEKNYDDYESNMMKKPFQGVRDNQSFLFDTYGLRIIIDENNDEFANNFYRDQILIPFKYIGDDLYIFDKYFDEKKSIYEKAKLTKKLLPNRFEYKTQKGIEEGNENYNISITQGEFINIPNKAIEDKLKELLVCKFDVEGFKNEFKENTRKNSHWGFVHNVYLPINAGGYLSVVVNDENYKNNLFTLSRSTFNYDFNKNKEMEIKDLFYDNVDVARVIKAYMKKINYPVPEDAIEVGLKEALKSNNFYFDEDGLTIYLFPKNVKLDDYQKWVWIPFREFGLENISILN